MWPPGKTNHACLDMRPVHARQPPPLTSHYLLLERNSERVHASPAAAIDLPSEENPSNWSPLPQREIKKKNSQTTTNWVRLFQRMQMECALLSVPMPDETLLRCSASERSDRWFSSWCLPQSIFSTSPQQDLEVCVVFVHLWGLKKIYRASLCHVLSRISFFISFSIQLE